jgi:hypothetical protein
LRDDIIEEIVDVMIVVEQLKMIYRITQDDIDKKFDLKMLKLVKHLGLLKEENNI